MILVTGGTGMVGRSLQKYIPDAVYIGRKDLDLVNQQAVWDFFQDKGDIDTVVHLAALVGGIKDNAARPYNFYHENVYMNTNVIHVCTKLGIKVLAMSSTCVYPASASAYPLTEDMVHLGMPEETSMSYGYAKRMMTVQLQAAKKQHGTPYILIYAGNLYGPNDCFDLDRSHLVASLIRRFHHAKTYSQKSIELLGTGGPMRQFTYVDDLSICINKLLQSEAVGCFNVAAPENLTIRRIAEIVRDVVGCDGYINFNGQLDGQFRKDVSCQRLFDQIGEHKFKPLITGSKETYDWYRSFVCGS